MEEQKGGFTETGKRVVLREDGSWAYRSESDPPRSPYDFRKTSWGMSRAQVKNLEKAELLKEGPEGLVYNGKVSSFPCFIAYFFVQDRLVRARYNLTNEHAYPGEYISEFGQLQSLLEKKYGPPAHTEQKWNSDVYRDDEPSWGKAVALGHLILWSAWVTATTEISLMLRGDNQHIFAEIEYCSRALAQLEDAEAEDAELEDF